jgi:serine/threonine protein kinase
MVHLPNLFHLPHNQQRSGKSTPLSSRRNSLESSSAHTDTSIEQWFSKHFQSNNNSKTDLHESLSPAPSRQTLTSVKSSESLNTAGTTKLHRLNTPSLREYGECYKRLGKGSTAIISICRSNNKKCQSSSKLYAIKQFRKRNKNETEKEYMKKLTSEFCISSTFRHVNVVETIDLVLDDQNRYCTVMEYCPGGDLFSVIMSGKMTEVEMACCFKQMMLGIAYLHSVGVAHRDLKPENLLLTLDGKLKITDFGVSDVFRCAWEKKGHKSHGLVGSEPYIAPEAFEKDHEYWGANADIWSAGIVLYAMWRGGHTWIRADKKTDREFRNYLRHVVPQTFPNFKKFDVPMRNLLYRMLDPNPDTRITSEQVLEDKWVQSILVCEKGVDTMNRNHVHTTAINPK